MTSKRLDTLYLTKSQDDRNHREGDLGSPPTAFVAGKKNVVSLLSLRSSDWCFRSVSWAAYHVLPSHSRHRKTLFALHFPFFSWFLCLFHCLPVFCVFGEVHGRDIVSLPLSLLCSVCLVLPYVLCSVLLFVCKKSLEITMLQQYREEVKISEDWTEYLFVCMPTTPEPELSMPWVPLSSKRSQREVIKRHAYIHSAHS